LKKEVVAGGVAFFSRSNEGIGWLDVAR